jgi:serine palmitoyltransferase
MQAPQNIPTIQVEGIQPSTRQRSFSLSNLVKRTRRAYSVSSAYPPSPSQQQLALPSFSSDLSSVIELTPAQRRNSIAAAQRKYEDFEQKIEAAPLFVLVSTYLNYFILIIFGHLRDILGKVFKQKKYAHLRMNEGYAPLVSDFDSFYTRRMYMRIRQVVQVMPIPPVAYPFLLGIAGIDRRQVCLEERLRF